MVGNTVNAETNRFLRILEFTRAINLQVDTISSLNSILTTTKVSNVIRLRILGVGGECASSSEVSSIHGTVNIERSSFRSQSLENPSLTLCVVRRGGFAGSETVALTPLVGQRVSLVLKDEVVALGHVAADTLESVLEVQRVFFGLVAVGNAGDVFAAGAGAGPFDVAETAVHANEFAGGVGDGRVGSWKVGDAVVRLFQGLAGSRRRRRQVEGLTFSKSKALTRSDMCSRRHSLS